MVNVLIQRCGWLYALVNFGHESFLLERLENTFPLLKSTVVNTSNAFGMFFITLCAGDAVVSAYTSCQVKVHRIDAY
ncbi:hypothetical protein ACTXT7_009595 [Hymenolepis weldensis]